MKRVIKTTGILLVLFSLLFVSVRPALAGPACDDEGINFCDLESVTLKSKFAGEPLGAIINALLPYIFSAAGILLLIYLVSGGFQYLTSGGDPGKTAAAKGKITNGLVGLIIIFTAFWIVQVVGLVLGIDGFDGIF